MKQPGTEREAGYGGEALMDDRALMEIYADTIFIYDSRGRMLGSNEPRVQERRPAPRLFLGRTRAGHVVRFSAAVSDDLANRLEEILQRLPPVDDLTVPPDTYAAVRQALERYGPIAKEEAGPAYAFPASIIQQEEVVQLTDATIEVVRHTYPTLVDEFRDWSPCFVALHEEVAVSICMSSRVTAVADAAGVDTLPAFRGRGYAASATAAWGAAIRQAGRIPLYSTSWDNLASQGVARRIGLIMFGAETLWA